MNIIFDEKRHAKQMIEKQKFIFGKERKELTILGKYYKNEGKDIEIIKNELLKFGFKKDEVKFKMLVNDVIKDVSNYELRSVDKIIIYKNEIDKINNLKSLKKGKDCKWKKQVAFTMLVLAKINNAKYGSGYYVNYDKGDIFALAKAGADTKEKNKILAELFEAKLISTKSYMEKLSYKVEFAEESGEVLLELDNFNDFIYEYQGLANTKIEVRHCDICTNPFLIKNKKNTSQKYCKECAKIEKNKQNKTYLHKSKILGKAEREIA